MIETVFTVSSNPDSSKYNV